MIAINIENQPKSMKGIEGEEASFILKSDY